jgi:hypothetical protein
VSIRVSLAPHYRSDPTGLWTLKKFILFFFWWIKQNESDVFIGYS